VAGINEWSSGVEFRLFEDMASHDQRMYSDPWVQNLYDAALFDYDVSTEDRSAILSRLRDYMWDEYGVDFDDVFDWEGFREAYDSAQI
jgi:hypothetical protein